jgi:uncharacterized protein (DUF433 family)
MGYRPGAGNIAIDWTGCSDVRVRPGYLSGKPSLRDDPRVPPETIVENMDARETAEQVIENFGLRTPLQDVLTVYARVGRQRVLSPV